MKLIVQLLGCVIIFGYIFKIIFHMYIKNKLSQRIEIGPGNTLKMEFFQSIKLDVPPKLEFVRKIVNLIHFSVVPYLALCLLYVALRFF